MMARSLILRRFRHFRPGIAAMTGIGSSNAAFSLLRSPAAVHPLAWRSFSATAMNNARRSRRPGFKKSEDQTSAENRQYAEDEIDQDIDEPSKRESSSSSSNANANAKSSSSSSSSSGNGNGNGSNSNTNGNGSKNPNNNPNYRIIKFEITATQIAWMVFGGLFLYTLLISSNEPPEISFLDFKRDLLSKGEVERIDIINNNLAKVTTHTSGGSTVAYFTIGSVEIFEQKLNEAQDKLGINIEDRVPVIYSEEGSFAAAAFGLLPTLMFLGFLLYMARGVAQKQGGAGGPMSGLFGVGKSKAHLYNPHTDLKVKFSEVAGMDEPKREIMEFVKFLKAPEKFEKLGAKIPRGAILSGAPGTGKTMLAKATAGEAGVPFFSVSGSEFVEMFSGVGASRVRDLFQRAKDTAPSMIWIDEIDAIGKARSGANVRGGNDEREATLNQLLVEMDGFGSNQRVVVLAGTNRVDMLDKALLRPGRFDRHINIDLPTLDGRRAIYDVHLAKINYDKSIPELSGKLAAMTPGFSGADIANCCNEAALAAARANATIIELNHFEIAIDRVIAGLERRSRVLPADKRKVVAYHEAGHAVAGWFLKYADPLVKVTIVPHGSAALGYAQLLPNDDTIVTADRMNDLIAVALGGRVSEELFFENVTAGASDDFKRITGIAKRMVCNYGYSAELGAVSLERQQGAVLKPYSEETDARIDAEVKTIIDAAHKVCTNLLQTHKDEVTKVAEALLSQEQLTRKDLVSLLGERPHKENENEAFKKFLDK